MNSVKKSVLDKIKKEEVKPRPKWQFIAMHVALWVVMAVSVILGSLAMSIIIREAVGTEWGYVDRIGKNGVPGFIMILPYVWVITLGIMLFIAYELFAHTKGGYKHRPLVIVGTSVLISLLLGIGLYFNRVSEKFERMVQDNVPPYAELQLGRQRIWVSPENGIIAGVIVDINDESLLILNDVTNKRWNVDITDMNFRRNGLPTIGDYAIIIGDVTGMNNFYAEEMRVRNDGMLPPRTRLP